MENGELKMKMKMKMKNYPHWLPLTQGELEGVVEN